jgi:tRNA 5-methylaminomethyl-2-thiouridine biosynthesis bifunctional protein
LGSVAHAPHTPRPFHEADPWGEKAQIYLRGHGLGASSDAEPGRWGSRVHWTVAELGTGTGCALACLLAAFTRHARPEQRLSYVGFERDPSMLDWWRASDRRQSAPEPERAALNQILDRPIRSTAGLERWSVLDGRATITLVLGDAEEWLPHVGFEADAWFLDAYEPAVESRLWTAPVLDQIARLTKPGGTATTFSAAGAVRRGLDAAGFDVERLQGFDGKRHMTLARRRSGLAIMTSRPWFDPPNPVRPERVTILGAGLAGAWCARAFAERGASVTVVDPRPARARGSGVPLAAAAQPDGAWSSEQVRMHDAAWHLLRGRCHDLGLPHRILPIAPTGHVTRLALLAAPPDMVIRLLDHSRIRRDASPPSDASVVVHCTGFLPDALTDSVCAHGQPLPNAGSIACMALDKPLDSAVMDHGYALPTGDGAHAWVGATNHPGRWSPPDAPARDGDAARGLAGSIAHGTHHGLGTPERAALAAIATQLVGTPGSCLAGWSGVRAASPDHLPLIGPVCDNDAFTLAYDAIRHGPVARSWPPCPYRLDSWCSLGHGSHGMLTAPLAAELIADLAFGTPRCLTDELLPFLLPQRFALRTLRRARD